MRVVQKAVQDSQSSCKSAKFTAKHRLSRKEGFDRAIKAESVSGKYFKIFFARNSGTGAKLGIITSKKMLPRAVDRNRAKRSVREVFRQHSVKNCKVDLVVMVRLDFEPQVVAQHGNLNELFSKVGNRCAES